MEVGFLPVRYLIIVFHSPSRLIPEDDELNTEKHQGFRGMIREHFIDSMS
jgi:hypothetical protein